uniref:Reverse transcriptase domain-containing protein n=1 Tax=Tanacetum cinerariifolium TaxID=118510 RepID=A0A6L2L157_TANCI|nr:reverse transcriptase domain-containing protein [Tanacetum cinerariifolium]
MKRLIAELPTITTPMEKEELIVYLAATREAVSAVLMTERDAKQITIYFVSRALQGRLHKWSIEPGEYNIHYMPIVSIKGQILADFKVERPKDDSLAAPMEVEEKLPDPWRLFTDGSSCVDGSGVGLILTNPERTEFTYALRFEFNATNNEAEYEAQIADLIITEQMAIKKPSNTLLKEKSINEAEVLTIVEEEGNTWMTPIYEYLTEETLPAEKKKASMHIGPRSVVAKVIRIGYYWPTMHKDARKVIRECQDFQVHQDLGKVKFLTVAIDYFTKWIEAKPVATITGNQIKKFVWDNIVCRFGLPGEIISDNGKQFRDNPFKDWCEKLNIRQCFASVKHPQTNGLVERANRSLGEGMKARLDKRSKDWMEEISHVLWAHRNMIKSSNGDTSFSLTYETEVVIPAKMGMPTPKTKEIDMVQNDEALKLNLDLLEEKREQAAIREARSEAKMKNTITPRGIEMEQENIQDRSVLSIDYHRPFIQVTTVSIEFLESSMPMRQTRLKIKMINGDAWVKDSIFIPEWVKI